MRRAGVRPRSTAESCTADRHVDRSQVASAGFSAQQFAAVKAHTGTCRCVLSRKNVLLAMCYTSKQVSHAASTQPFGAHSIPVRSCVSVSKCFQTTEKHDNLKKISLDKCIYFIANASGTRIISHAATDKISACCPGECQQFRARPISSHPPAACFPVCPLGYLFMGLSCVCMEGDVLTSTLLNSTAFLPARHSLTQMRVQSSCQRLACTKCVHKVWITLSVNCLKAYTVLLPSGHRNLILPTPGTAKAPGIIRILALPLFPPPPAGEDCPTRRSCQSLHTKMLT